MNSEELKRQADAVLGDEQKELLKELLLSEKVTRNTAVENTKELQNALSSLEKSLSSETTKLSDLLYDLKVLVNDGKVNLPELYKVYVENQQAFPDSVTVSNLKDIEFPKAEKFPEEVGLRESSWLSVHFKGLLGAVLSLKKDVQAVKIEGSGDAKRPIAVRLSDGKKFIDTLVTAVSSATRQTFPFVTSTGEAKQALVDSDGHLQIDADVVVGDLINTDSRFKTNAIDDYTTTNVTYICKEDSSGVWYICKIDETGNFPVFTYASITNNPTLTTYTLAYAARTTATYNIYETAF
jgi:hypothetical protein